MSHKIFLATLALLVLPSAARAQDKGSWAASFPPERVGEYIESPPPRMIVIPAGEDDAAPAAEALREALRRSNKTALVMNQAPLGKVAALDDETIVKRAARLPVERIAIVRAFPGGKGSKDSAVVTVYDKRAATVVAFTAVEGVALSSRGHTEGLLPGAAGAVHEVLRQDKEDHKSKDDDAAEAPPSAAEEEWQHKAVWFQDWAGINQYGAIVSTWSIPLRGVQHERVDGARFYDAIDRPDLARQFRKKHGVRVGLAVSGAVALGAAIGTMTWALLSMTADGYNAPGAQGQLTYQYPPSSSSASPGLTWGLTGGLFAGGMGLMLAAVCMQSNPVGADEARQMAIDYDINLRKKLGLPPLRADNEPRPSPLRRVSGFAIAPAFAPGSGGLQASFRF
jgi:hypothetical protein